MKSAGRLCALTNIRVCTSGRRSAPACIKEQLSVTGGCLEALEGTDIAAHRRGLLAAASVTTTAAAPSPATTVAA